MKRKNPVTYLKAYEGHILKHLKSILESKDFNYRTFGSAIEEHLSDALVNVLTKGAFIKNAKDYFLAPNKNYFPDFELKSSPALAIEFKVGNKSQFRKGKWVNVKNSENDLGTLNTWPDKIKKFGGKNIYFIFVLYNFDDTSKKILSVKFLPFYQLIGINKGQVLKYREKDGNLRPKNFDSKPQVKTLDQFESLLVKTIIYRSQRIIKKHTNIIKKALTLVQKDSD